MFSKCSHNQRNKFYKKKKKIQIIFYFIDYCREHFIEYWGNPVVHDIML